MRKVVTYKENENKDREIKKVLSNKFMYLTLCACMIKENKRE